jgi:hypothetical protein
MYLIGSGVTGLGRPLAFVEFISCMVYYVNLSYESM